LGAPPAAPSAAPSLAPASAGPSIAPAAAADPKITARAKDWLHRAQTANIDHAQLDDKMSALLTDAFAKQVAAQLSPLGDPVTFEFVEEKTFAPNTLYVYKVTFKSDTLYWLFSTNVSGMITGLRLVTPPK
ncbi:MAG: hypothetical protein IAI50_08545, partial [Candidatus Eremiobacteraeota bacterium]|nr:hypothetical protein [Candidatus Eremiobacteraeota bacterium]